METVEQQAIEVVREHPDDPVRLRIYMPYGRDVQYTLRETQLLQIAMQLLAQMRQARSGGV